VLLLTRTVSGETPAIALITVAVLYVYGLLSVSLGKALARGAAIAAAVVTILSAIWAHHEGSGATDAKATHGHSSRSAP
jgi:uncharacterized membrane protein YjjB (DUF3815 family)